MSIHRKFRNVTEALPGLLRTLNRQGTRQGSRNGGTKELLNVQLTLTHPLEREVLTPERKASYPAQIAETMWVLAGRDDVEWLSHYLKRAPEFSDDGKVWHGGYGPRIRRWSADVPHGTLPIGHPDTEDQLAHVVKLLKSDPETRRAVIAIYDPAADIPPEGVSPLDVPCNDFLQFIARDGKLSLTVFTRSNDIIWGWSGINQFEWSALLEIVAGLTLLEAGSVTFNITSLHLYNHHEKKAEKILTAAAGEMIDGPPDHAPAVRFRPAEASVEHLDKLIQEWFHAEHNLRTAKTEWQRERAMELVRAYPEPMLRSWLLVLADWWGVEPLGYPFIYTAQKAALAASPGRQVRAGQRIGVEGMTGLSGGKEPHIEMTSHSEFTQFVADLHAEKHKVYGDSWKRRGEMVAILANIARKVDRLGVAGAGDTASDTVIDLLVYLVKYRAWLTEHKEARKLPFYPGPGANLSDLVPVVDDHLRLLNNAAVRGVDDRAAAHLTQNLVDNFEELLTCVAEGGRPNDRANKVDGMIRMAFPLARHLWLKDQETEKAEAWKRANATRSWKGYDPDDLEALTGDGRALPPETFEDGDLA